MFLASKMQVLAIMVTTKNRSETKFGGVLSGFPIWEEVIGE